MKKLIVSVKSSGEVFKDFKKAFRDVEKRKLKTPHFEISFDNRKDFDRFVTNIHILQLIKTLRPSSVYELAKRINMDVSNLNKIITFFENLGVIEVSQSKNNGRQVRSPKVNYDKIEFNLAA